MRNVLKSLMISVGVMLGMNAVAQTALYPQHFSLNEVTLLDSPFKTAMEKNFQTLLSYDYYRLLTPYIRQAGLTTGDYEGWEAEHPSFANWGSEDFNLDGHVGGHYLTALSLAYAACRDVSTKEALKARADYMVSVMKDCQDVYNDDNTGLKGFIGGQPMNEAWQKLYSIQDITLKGTGECAVPWYCQHKILAGLRDAYVYMGSETAKAVFLKLCDWCILVTSTLNDDQMEWMLNNEHGGVNETLLDAYKLTGEDKYLTAAKRFTHKYMLNGLQTASTTFLDNKHANTQVPKYIGMERIAELDASATNYQTAAENFWTDVAENRTVCIGGNSMYEHFLAASNSAQYINHADGPESCNTNNMLKLSEMAFDRTHDAKYADFYEYGMWNHILSTQDPTKGGYVYFTTLRPQGYRIYSTVNESMWCCVGTGMENHSKYGHFIYTHDGTSKLYVNLFTASELDNDDFKIRQETSFPFANTSTLTVQKAGSYTIAIRHPRWAADGYAVAVNGSPVGISVTKGTASYVEVNRTWADGDVITVTLPMELRYTPCPNYTDYIAFQYGPILLAAQTSTSDEEEAASKHLRYEASMQNEYGHEGRMDHSPSACGKSLSLTTAPLLIGDRDGENGVLSKITASDLSRLQFTLDANTDVMEGYTWTDLTLQPFYQIQHARYSCYWYQQTAENYANSSMAADEAAKAAIEARTLDFVGTGEQQSEAGHYRNYNNSGTGSYNDEYYRDAAPSDGYIQDGYIQYTLSYEGEAIESGLSVLCRFTQADAGRKATLYVDGTAIANITSLAAFNGADDKGFYNVEYPIPAHLMRDANDNIKKSFVICLSADKGTFTPGLYYLRLMKEYDAKLPATVPTTAGAVRTVIDGVVTGENGQSEMSHSFNFTGNNNDSNHGTYQDKYWRCATSGEYYGYDLQTNGVTDGVSLVVEYWADDYDRLADISIDGVTIATQEINNLRSAFVTLEYPIDPVLLQDKKSVHVQFTSVANKYTAGSYNVYLTSGRNDASLGLTPYTFLNTNFEKNGTDGNISSITYNDGAMQIASAGGDNSLNMRMKKSVSGTYSITPNQYLLTVKGQNLSTSVASLWWIMGCNRGGSDAPTYTCTDGSDNYLVWDLRKIWNFTDEEKNARFFGTEEVAVSTSDGGDYSLLCMGLTSTAEDHSAVISDISFYSPEQLVDKYSVLKNTVNSMATGLAADSKFAYGDYVYAISPGNDKAEATGKLSTAEDYSKLPATLFGYTVDDISQTPEYQNLYLSDNGDGTFTNPVIRADYPDPDVVRLGDTFYFVSTTMHNFPGATVLKSKDLVNWEYCAQPLEQLASNDKYNLIDGKDAYSQGMWAAAMGVHNGRLYILINGNDAGGFILSTDDPEGQWQMKKIDRIYYDPGMLFDNGKVYVVSGINTIVMNELDEDFNFQSSQVVIEREGMGLEGSHLYKIGDYYYIYSTYGGWPTGQTIFRSESIWGPYEEKLLVEKYIDDKPNTVHQGALVDTPTGEWWTMLMEDLGPMGRLPNLQPVVWADGWPVVGNNGVPVQTCNKPDVGADYPMTPLPTNDVFRSYPLGMQWEWNHNPDNGAWSLFERPGWLRLKARNTAADILHARNTLTQRIFIDSEKPSNGTICMDISQMKEGDVAGLVIIQDPYAAISVTLKDEEYQLVWEKDVLRTVPEFQPESQSVTLDGAPQLLYLRAQMAYSTGKCRFFYSTDNATWTALGPETQLSYNLSVFVGTRFGIFCYHDADTPMGDEPGWIDVDWFTTEDTFDESTFFPDDFPGYDEDMLTAVSLSAPENIELLIGNGQQLDITATFADGRTENVSASTKITSNSSCVTVAKGVVTGCDEGEAIITAAYTDPMGNTLTTEITVRSTFFPFSASEIVVNIYGDTNNYDEATRTFTPGQYGQLGWKYGDGADMSGYKYLVLNLKSEQNCAASLKIFPENSIWGDCYSTEIGTRTQVVVNLQDAILTSGDNMGNLLDASHIYIVSLWGNGEGSIVADDMYLTNNDDYSRPSGDTEPERIYDEVITQETSEKSCFTVSDASFKLDFWGTDNTKNETDNAFTLAADGNSVGWDYYYSGKLDISAYDKLVVKLKSVSDDKIVQFRIFGMKDADNEAPGNYVVDLGTGNGYTAEIDLTSDIITNNDLGGASGAKIDLTRINSLRFWAWAGEVTATIDEMYLEKTGAPNVYLIRKNTETNKYGTICLPFAASVPDNATVYDIEGWDDSYVYLEEADAMEAGKAYVFKSSDDQDITFTKTGTDDDLPEPATSTNMLYGQFSGSATVPVNSYILKNGQWKRVTGNTNTVKNYRAYLTLDNDKKVPEARSFISMNLEGDGGASGINEIQSSKVQSSNNVYYDLCGRRVSKPTKGLYIVNGKKVFIQ